VGSVRPDVVSRDFLRTDRARKAFDAAAKEWDLAVVDEAHGFTIAVDGKGYINKRSERYKAAEALARRSQRLILMTATPHFGRDYGLWALLRHTWACVPATDRRALPGGVVRAGRGVARLFVLVSP
jgi:hypothetical protein